MDKFTVNSEFTFSCRYYNRLNGFQHNCTLYKGDKRLSSCHIEYWNRTWELFNFQSVMQHAVNLARSNKKISEAQQEELLKWLKEERRPDWKDIKIS